MKRHGIESRCINARWLDLGNLACVIILTGCLCMETALPAYGGGMLQKCTIGAASDTCRGGDQQSGSPTCGIEITCTDKPVQLGYSDGVCFRATCPGIWALTHKRIDQVSFRRRIITYRHYHFAGYWQLKDQGAIESGPNAIRELFLVLPDDLIEFKLRDPDCNSAVEVRNVGYVKKGTVEELKHWLAYNVYLERPDSRGSGDERTSRCTSLCGNSGAGGFTEPYLGILSGITSVGRFFGLPLCR